MNFVTKTLISAINWSELRTESGSGVGLPQAVHDLSNATSTETADDAYWRIDNEALVQGELFEAAVPTLEVLLSLAGTVPPGPARRSVSELIQQMVFGQPHESELKLGNSDLDVRCKALAAEALWIFYGWLTDLDEEVRECALLTLSKVEPNSERRSLIFSACRAADQSPGMQKLFSQIDRKLF